MTRPEEALALARARVAEARARGAYAAEVDTAIIEPVEAATLEQLLEWAIVEPDMDEVRSTRRFGAPITFLKRMLARALRQYNGQIVAQQQRFNIQLALYLAQLADRVERLEETRD